MARSKKPRGKPDVGKLLSRFAAQEADFLKQEFLAPALRGGQIRIRIAGVVCTVRIKPAAFAGWGVFQPNSHAEATLVRKASLAERRSYLELFPLVRLIICRRAGQVWHGSAASFGDRRIHLQGMAPVNLAEEVQLFDCVRTRYDGSRFWFHELDTRHDPAAAAYLRSALSDGAEPQDVRRRGLTPEERAAYELNYWEAVRPAHMRSSAEELAGLAESDIVRSRLRESLSHAGAQLVDYLERADSFRVTFVVGARQYTSSVNKDDLTVQVAGICLSGQDRNFDLSSLVGVVREAAGGGEIVPIGDENEGMDEQDYWRAHPPRN